MKVLAELEILIVRFTPNIVLAFQSAHAVEPFQCSCIAAYSRHVRA